MIELITFDKVRQQKRLWLDELTKKWIEEWMNRNNCRLNKRTNRLKNQTMNA